jgi:hypothetical protein
LMAAKSTHNATCVPNEIGPPPYIPHAGESFGRVLEKSARNYFLDIQISKVLGRPAS